MNIKELKQALAAYKENARTKSIGLAMSSYRLDRMLHDNAEELVRLAEIGESLETERKGDPLGEALNSGDGVYRP